MTRILLRSDTHTHTHSCRVGDLAVRTAVQQSGGLTCLIGHLWIRRLLRVPPVHCSSFSYVSPVSELSTARHSLPSPHNGWRGDRLSDQSTDMGKSGEEYHFEYRPGSRVSLKDFMHKFESFMNFEKNSHTNLGRSMWSSRVLRESSTLGQ